MHTEQTANFSVRASPAPTSAWATTTSCGCRRRSGTRPASTTGCASRSTTGCRSCCRTGGTAPRPPRWCDRLPLLVHARGDDVPPGPHQGGAPPPASTCSSLRFFGCGAVAACRRALVDAGRRARHPGAAPLRQHRGAGRHVEPAVVRRPNSATPTASPMSAASSSRCATSRARSSGAGRRGRAAHPAARTRASGSSPTRSARRRRSAPTGSCAAATWSTIDERRLPHRGRAQEGDHHPRWREHRPARDRGADRRLPGGGAGRGDRPAASSASASGVRARRARSTARRSTSTRWSPACAPPAWPPTSCRSGWNCSIRCRPPPSGKIQKHEIVAALAGAEEKGRSVTDGIRLGARRARRARRYRQRRRRHPLNRPDQLNPIDSGGARPARRARSTRSRPMPSCAVLVTGNGRPSAPAAT